MNRLETYLATQHLQPKELKGGMVCIETILLQNGTLPLLKFHKERIIISCSYLGIDTAVIEEIVDALLFKIQEIITPHAANISLKLRCLLNIVDVQTYNWDIEYSFLNTPYKITDLHVGSINVNFNVMPIMALKTSNRTQYQEANNLKLASQLNDVIIINNGFVVDSTIGNVVLLQDEKLITPKLSSGCVAGCMLQAISNWCKQNDLLLEENNLTLEDCSNGATFWLVNAVRGIMVVSKFNETSIPNDYENIRQSILNHYFNK